MHLDGLPEQPVHDIGAESVYIKLLQSFGRDHLAHPSHPQHNFHALRRTWITFGAKWIQPQNPFAFRWQYRYPGRVLFKLHVELSSVRVFVSGPLRCMLWLHLHRCDEHSVVVLSWERGPSQWHHRHCLWPRWRHIWVDDVRNDQPGAQAGSKG